ncbi:MAG TPA: twin-arginine translocase subunit TatC [Candidatus Limnocylindria bacterium]|nr:twin-arginine translocase subunit TatC [Candidatus Limnocylindria bacterium]
MTTPDGKGHHADVQMPFTSHLGELRSRLIKSVLAIAIAFSACFYFVDTIFAILAAPVRRLNIPGLTIIGTGVTEAFFTRMKLGFVAALVVALPVLLWQGWQFVAPGLYEHEKRHTRSFVFAGSLCFCLGAAFSYAVVVQHGLNFLLHRYEVIGVTPMLQIADYLSTVSRLLLVSGAMFELPVIAFFTARVGLIDHRFLIRHSRYALIAIALLAAILTPPDLISQILLMVPLLLLYGLSIAVAYLARFRMDRRERAAQ